jgi:predicted nucleic acid-binding protein
MIVVSNTSPICYLVLIGESEILPSLFGEIIIPQAVCNELSDLKAPIKLQKWIAQPPNWLRIQPVVIEPDATLEKLHLGESEAIAIAEQLQADLIIIDEKAARQIAYARRLRVTGLLGLLDDAASANLLDLPAAVARLQQTNFRASPKFLRSLLEKHQPIS